ncbi:MAG: hypothetical protein ACOVQR_03015 [Flavobacterium sp.]|jgi:hypothetical protein|uniref:hypothetical protein n=1 Tax=Flavobacterium sp. TaxID=239 RepID=UPI003BA762D4
MSKIHQYNDLISFGSELIHFPASNNEHPHNFDLSKLSSILRDKEINEVCNPSVKEIEQFYELDNKFGVIVKDMVFERHLEKSLREYEELDKSIETNFTGKYYLFVKQWAYSLKALYFYKTNDFEKAKALTIESIALVDYLMHSGTYNLNTRCFELIKNVAKVYLKENKQEEGYEIIRNLLDYIFNGNYHSNLIATFTKHKVFFEETPILREDYGLSIFIEILENTIFSGVVIGNSFLPNQWFIKLEIEVDTLEKQILYNFIHIEQKRQEKKYNEYIDAIHYFFEQEYSSLFDPLKVYLLFNYYQLTKKNNSDGEWNKEEIVNFIQNKIIINQKLKEKVISNL